MKTPWSDLLKYGIGTATLAVILGSGILLLVVVALAVVIAKISAFIK